MLAGPPTKRLASQPAIRPTTSQVMSCCALMVMDFSISVRARPRGRAPARGGTIPRSVADSSGHVESPGPDALTRGKRKATSCCCQSNVERATVGGKHALVHHLGERGMREDRVHQVLLGGFELHRNHEPLDQLGHLGTDQ